MMPVMTFDDFVPGAVLGETTEAFDPLLAAGWQRIFGTRLPDGEGDAENGGKAGTAGTPGTPGTAGDASAARDPAGESDAAQGAGIAVVMMMRAYLAVVASRPPGNIHARQGFTLAAPPQPGERIRSVVTCVGKEMKRGRRHVEFRTEGTGAGGRPIYTGRMALIWAA